MDLPGLDHCPGKGVEAEIHRRFNSPVSFDPSRSAREFFLVASFGRCKFCLSEFSVASLLQSVIGGSPSAFRIRFLSNRVFHFSVNSQEVGFHIYRLRAYECVNFKVFFHLWNRGGPNYALEYKRWSDEQASEWVEVAKRNSAPNSLSAANAVHLGLGRVHHVHPNFNSNVQKSAQPNFNPHKSAFTRAVSKSLNSVSKGLNWDSKGILGPLPAHRRSSHSSSPTCQLNWGIRRHLSGYSLAPRSTHPSPTPTGDTANLSGEPALNVSMHRGTVTGYKAAYFSSFFDYSRQCLGLSPPPLLIVPWKGSRTRKITAPDFDTDDPPPPSRPSARRPQHLTFASFGEFARVSLGIASPPPPVHVAWVLKTPLTVASMTSSSQDAMAFVLLIPDPLFPMELSVLWCQASL